MDEKRTYPSYDPLRRLVAEDWRARAGVVGRCEVCDGYGSVEGDGVLCTRCGGTGTDEW